MTPQLMQAIKLLQLSNLDLTAYVEGELERNPLLERPEGPEGAQAGENAPNTLADAPREAPENEWAKPDVNGSAAIEDSFDTADRERVSGRRRGAAAPDAEQSPPPIRNGPASAPADARTATTISKPSSRPSATLGDHLAEQLSLAIADPVHRIIGQHLIDSVDEAGYLTADLGAIAEKFGAPLIRGRSRARRAAEVRSARCVRAQSRRMPHHPVEGARPLRPRDGGADRASRPGGAARLLGVAPPVRRRRCGPGRHDRRDPQAQSEARPRLRFGGGAADRTRRVRARRAGWLLAGRAEFRHAAEGAGEPVLSREGLEDREERPGEDLSGGLPADRDLAHSCARSARQDHPESLDRDRAPAGRLLRARRPVPAPAQPEDRRRRDRHARVDRLARHRQQIHGDEPRHLRTEVLLHVLDRGIRRRRGAFGRGGAPSHQAADRRGEPPLPYCPTTRSSTNCARPASTSRGER